MTDSDLGRLVRRNKTLLVIDAHNTLFDMDCGAPLPGGLDLIRACHKSGVAVMVSTDSLSSDAAALLNIHKVVGMVDNIVGWGHSPIDDVRLDVAVCSFRSKKTDHPVSDPEVIVIDDDHARVRMAVERGYKFIGVCTGDSTKQDFERGPHKPHLVVERLTDPKVMETILGSRTARQQPRTKVTA